MSHFWETVILTVLILLVPLAPALLIHSKVAPGKTHVSGMLKGMKVQITGALAGYFSVALLAWVVVETMMARPEAPAEELWTIQGRVLIDSAPPVEPSLVRFRLSPPSPRMGSDGKFLITGVRFVEDGETPDITIGAESLPQRTILLRRQHGLQVDAATRTIDIGAINLSRVRQQYRPDSSVLLPTPPGGQP